jgi:uncharacterized cupin superfamily protein
VPNAFSPHFDEERSSYGVNYGRARIGYQAGCERLGLSLWELPPGQEGIYHFHYGSEELLVVLSGRPSLRTPIGWRQLREGEVAAFPRGPGGAHAVSNRSDDVVRFLFFSEMSAPEVAIYPDLEIVGALERMSAPERGGFAAWLRLADAFEHHPADDEGPPPCPAAKDDRASLPVPRFDAEGEREGFRHRRARLGRQAGSERLGASLYEIEPGQSPWPYHWHAASEELLIAVSGTPSLRTPSGWQRLVEGDVVAFPSGETGAHQVHNRSGSAAQVLIVSEMTAPEVAFYPDSEKVGVFGSAPGAPRRGKLEAFFALESEVDFWHGETPPGD